MSDEVQNLAEVPEVPAPEQEATAAPESEEAQAPEAEQTESSKSFTQEELDAIVSKRLAREQRKWEREMRMRQEQPVMPREVPPADQFESVEAYAEALAERKAQELLQQRQVQQQQAQMLEAYHEREEEARGKYDDFEQVAYNPNVPITTVMAETIRASDVGPDVAYYLGSNPREADRISKLPPYLQAKELGKIEVKLADSPPVKKTSSAPAPIAPVTARGLGKAVDTTDPRSLKEMSTSEWIEAERMRQIKKWEAQRNR